MYRNLRRFVVGSIAFFSRRTARAISQHAQHFNYDEDLAKLSTVMRATAFMQRAYSHGRALTDLLQKVVLDMPTQATLDTLHELWEHSSPSAKVVLLGMFARDCEGRGSLYQKTKFRYGLYEFALLRACEDALRATETLPTYSQCWLKAGDALTALRKPREAAGYYQVALDLDSSMEDYLRPKIEALSEGNGEDALATLAGF